MNAESNRRFWQIHLSTAVVLMFVAGVLLWANIRMNNSEILQKIKEEDSKEYRKAALNGYIGLGPSWAMMAFQPEHGWPWTAYHARSQTIYSVMEGRPAWSGIAGDACIAILILVAAKTLFEWLIRYRESRP